MIITKYVLGPVQTNCFLLEDEDSKEAVLIDPGDKSSEISSYISENNLNLKYIINTHGHFDHTGGNAFFFSNKTKIASHESAADLMREGGGASFFGIDIEKSPEPSLILSDGDSIVFGSIDLKVIYTPGHTQGCISLYNKKTSSLFCGDALFFRSIGRTDFPGGNHEQLLSSIKEKLYTLPGETKVYTGHGPETVIADEKKNNPWTA